MNKSAKFFVFLLLLFLINSKFPTQAEISKSNSVSSVLSCEPRIYFVNSSYQLPYRYDGKELVNGSSVVGPNDYLIYSIKIKNPTSQRQTIEKIYVQQLLGVNEPITILDAQPVNGSCSVNNQDKSILCLTNYSFLEEATDPIYILLKINSSINNIPKTSSLFSVKTNLGTTECASLLWLKDERRENPIYWSTPYASFKSTDFFIRIGNQKFYGVESVQLSSDPGVEKTTLEAIWQENGKEMRMFMYFRKKENNMWEMYELRTYNGAVPGDWIYYQDSLGNKVESLIGYPNYAYERRFAALNGVDAEIYCKDCSINAFLWRKPPISEEGYILEPLIGLPEGKIITIVNDPMVGYGVNVLLKDKNGEIVKNQQGMSYQWSVTDPNIVQIVASSLPSENGCIYNIQPPCPLNHVDISGINPGKTEIKVEVLRETDGVLLASTSFPVLVVNQKSLPYPELCGVEGEIIKKDTPKKCCSSLILVPPLDDRIDIFGTCLKPCLKDEDCGEKQICSLTKSNQLVCVPGTRTEKQIGELRKDIEEIKSEQNKLSLLLNKIVEFLRQLFRFNLNF